MDDFDIKRSNYVSYIGIIVSILAGIISVYVQNKEPQTGLFLFLALIGAIIFYFLISWPVEYFRKKMKMIDLNSKKIEDMGKDLNIVQDKLNFKSDVSKLDTRISVLEQLLKMKNNKKGQIDPRWVVIIIILILLYLYLRSKGLI
jgi:hypothetical protein